MPNDTSVSHLIFVDYTEAKRTNHSVFDRENMCLHVCKYDEVIGWTVRPAREGLDGFGSAHGYEVLFNTFMC